mmetsp:Transcript_32515/g.71545  ORF Transcript_32515/g.71545 Transcript_32515/m.71545 type:complete len:273 (-) Transcript_32515:450-1268(-)
MSSPSSPKKVTEQIETAEEQRELFLWKYRDVKREAVNVMFAQFKRLDVHGRGELTEHEAMQMFEKRGSIKTARELRQLVMAMDTNKNKKLTLLEWLCAHFGKSFADLNDFVDMEARARALVEAMEAGKEAEQAEAAIAKARENKELQAQIRAEALERESKLTGVAGMKAFFARQAENAGDTTKTNEQTIKEEAARRKALREAKSKLNAAVLQAAKVKSAEEIAAEVKAVNEQRKADETAVEKKRMLAELAARAERKAALNAKWDGGAQSPTK